MLGEDGQKMSKSKRNYREPSEIFDKYGADALRWYFFANQPPWTSIRYSEQAIKDSIPEFLLRLWNCLSASSRSTRTSTGLIRQRSLIAATAGQLTPARSRHRQGLSPGWRSAASSIAGFSANSIARRPPSSSGWMRTTTSRRASDHCVRRWRCRIGTSAAAAIGFGRDGQAQSPDKLDAYWTLYECLMTTAKLIAPFTPFLAEALWQNLAGVFGERAVESVHLCDYPTGDASGGRSGSFRSG